MKLNAKFFLSALVLPLILQLFSLACFAKPKLVLVLVYDQMRGDQLLRHKDLFLKPTLKDKQVGGFRYLTENGAYFPWAEYETLQNMTCPGHAMILTGSYPYINGIPLNDFWDVQKNKLVYCAQDDEFEVSPRRMKGSTIGDQLKLVSPQSQVFAISLKDRSAIMLGGKSADLALWLNTDTMQLESVSYYIKDKKWPSWVNDLNKQTQSLLGQEIIYKPIFTSAKFEYKAKVGSSLAQGFPQTEQLTFEASKKLIEANKLGQGSQTDILAISFSSNDALGHHFGADSDEMKESSLQQDRRLSEFLNYLNKTIPGGLKNILIAVTADHGVAPLVEHAQKFKLDAGRVDQEKLKKDLNTALNTEFGSLKTDYISHFKSFNFYFSKEAQGSKDFDKILNFAKQLSLKEPGIETAFTVRDYENKKLPPGQFEAQIKKSYVPDVSGHLVLIAQPFWYEQAKVATTHLTGYTYDRTVPIILLGQGIKPGTYLNPAKVVDLAPTLSHLLGQIAPALSEGRILNEGLK
jgi:predicted AlkP superfamily pyrophosphatase or phosphodiesterase